MLILAINTASSKTAIALLEKRNSQNSIHARSVCGVRSQQVCFCDSKNSDMKIIAEDSWVSENREAEKLMPAIHNLLRKKSKNYTDIGEIYVVKGPGSFTGLRVGVTVANTLAYLLNCKLYGITAFEYWHEAEHYPVLIYAGSGGIYFSKNKNFKPILLQLSETEKFLKIKKIKTVCGDITVQQKQYLKTIKFLLRKKTFGEIMEKIIEDQELKLVKIVEPVYVKLPGITQPAKGGHSQ